MRTPTRIALTLVTSAALAATCALPAAAHKRGPSDSRDSWSHDHSRSSDAFPDVIELPADWNAEGIAAGRGTTVYSGSLSTGAVWKGDVRTGEGSVLVPAQPPRAAAGLKYQRGLLFVAGGPTGQAYVYDAATGEDVETYQLAPSGTAFINDVTVTDRAAWFTDSRSAVLYRVRLHRGQPYGDPVALPLSGEWVQVPGPMSFNANGIAAAHNGRHLLVVNGTVGAVFRVNARTGRAVRVETDAELTAGDGILLHDRTLYVVRNRMNEVAVLRLSGDLESARLIDTLTDEDFAVPTTIARVGRTLYAVNARFGMPPGPFTIVKVDGS